jgi:hypothetical protein
MSKQALASFQVKPNYLENFQGVNGEKVVGQAPELGEVIIYIGIIVLMGKCFLHRKRVTANCNCKVGQAPELGDVLFTIGNYNLDGKLFSTRLLCKK